MAPKKRKPAKKAGKVKTLKPKKKGQKPIKFKEGGMHATLGVAQGVPIPKGMFQAALHGSKGKLAQKQAMFKKNVLTGRKKRKGK